MRSCLLGLFSAGLLLGCGAEIGDACQNSAECGQGRICDQASRAGYCTASPCEPGSCPDEALCVEFENEETYCMARCSGNDDCRPGYVCDRETASKAFCRQAP